MLAIKSIIKYTKKLKVLYVEDEVIMRTSSLEMLENFFDVIELAQNGEEALEMYKQNDFDLVLTDLSMPKMDGLEFISLIRKDNKTIPIVVFSALKDPSYMNASISLNVDGYILKPMKKNNLVETLEKIVHKVAFNESAKDTNKEESFKIDKLTHLQSHTSLMDTLHSVSKDEIPAMILLNIDAFHTYNELYGLDVGDEILVSFAKKLETFTAALTYTLYRMGGDEFVFFEKVHIVDIDKYQEDVEALLDFIENNKIYIDGIREPISFSVSIGISFDKDNCYGMAGMALNEARRRGRKYLGFSSDADRRKTLENNLYWREEINKAIEEQRVHAYYHPIYDRDENILKYESLIRIKSGDELISPSEFLDFSKISQQYIALTEIMINESFKTMLECNVHVAINLTFHDIENHEINKLLRERITKHHLESKTKFDISSQVIFELLEHSNHEDYDKFMSFINEFKGLGVLITIDNFGLGFDNMAKISAISPNYVKIDATLMKNIDTDKHAYTLVKSIVRFAKELGIKTIAEHVTNEAIFEVSKSLGIDEFQGYHFGEPLEAVPECNSN